MSLPREPSRGATEARAVAELLVETLQAAGVWRVFGVAGDSLNGVTDALSAIKRTWIMSGMRKWPPLPLVPKRT